jgi:hypothetical protein
LLKSLDPEWCASLVCVCSSLRNLPWNHPFHLLVSLFISSETTPQSDNISPLGGCGIQFRQGKKNLFFDYDLVDSVKEWHSEWFYAGNMLPALAALVGRRTL